MAQRQECYKVLYNNRNKDVREIHKALYDATINKNKASRQLYVHFYKLTKRIKTQKTDDAVLFILQHDIDKSRKVVNTEIRNREQKAKEDIFKKEVDDNREKGKWFYICSKHYDCAKDHEDFQGRIYYDEKAPREIIDYAWDRNMYSLQWVTGKPVWLVTRPYCRHYFTAYTYEEIRQGKYKVPVRKVGDYDLQTPARARLEYWQDQLAIAEKLSPKTEKIQSWIDKCKIMVRKWR